MKELNFHPLAGLMHEPNKADLMRDPDAVPAPSPKESLKNANRLFWETLLAKDAIHSMICLAQNKYLHAPCEIVQSAAVLENPELFVNQVEKALVSLDRPVVAEQSFFVAMETLTILCKMYSEFVYHPFQLSVSKGFALNRADTRVLVRDSLSPVGNPYYGFVSETIFPAVEADPPGILWLMGTPGFDAMALAMLVKQKFPKTHICVVDSPGEYYSLKKIRQYLKENRLLFRVIDSILLEDGDEARAALIRAVEENTHLDEVPELLYFDAQENRIKESGAAGFQKKVIAVFPDPAESRPDWAERRLLALKLWNRNACYWNRCTFCGINGKYSRGATGRQFRGIDEKIGFIREMALKGYRFFWLNDEAVPPDVLRSFSKDLIKENLDIFWQVRSRIDAGFTREVCEILTKAGLREIRFGLESANPRILKLMNKFPRDFDPALVERVVKRCHESGISVHLCLLLDFPTETYEERAETFEFLRRLKHRYPSVTFNLNRFMLDITTRVYEKYETFGITSIEWPCPARHFLGNTVKWDSNSRYASRRNIDAQRNGFMREILYPWMPSTSITPAFNFYAQYENQALTLLRKADPASSRPEKNAVLYPDTRIVRSRDAVYSKKQGNGTYRFYIWNTHHYYDCDPETKALYDIFTRPQTIGQGLERFRDRRLGQPFDPETLFEQYKPQLEKALQYGGISICRE